MIKDKLHTISDDDAKVVAEILLKNSTSSMFNFSFDKITRQEYIEQHGVDAEESVNIFFNAKVRNEQYVKGGWKDKRVWIQLIESDRYHNYPYFTAHYKQEQDKTWKFEYISNYIEAVEFLQAKQLI